MVNWWWIELLVLLHCRDSTAKWTGSNGDHENSRGTHCKTRRNRFVQSVYTFVHFGDIFTCSEVFRCNYL